jgi:hypothetical protein
MQYCPVCGKNLKTDFHYDHGYATRGYTSSLYGHQFANTLLTTISSIFITMPVYYYIFHHIEHNISSYSTTGINVIFIILTLLLAAVGILFNKWLRRKQSFARPYYPFRIIAMLATGFIVTAYHWFAIILPLGNAHTYLQIVKTYNIALGITIAMTVIGIILLIMMILRKKLSIGLFVESLTLCVVFQLLFYYVTFNLSRNANLSLMYFLYLLPALLSVIVSGIVLARHILHK